MARKARRLRAFSVSVRIVGLGGSGAYTLDLVVKTPVDEIHLFDGDVFSQHNAFRAPGTATLEQLRALPKKVAHFAEVYSAMRRGIVPHDMFLDDNNVEALAGLDFVFVCIDKGAAKRVIVRSLEVQGIPFIEVGMGVLRGEDGLLAGIIRVTTSTPENRKDSAKHISYSEDGGIIDEYATNIQLADLNALTASLAVGRWKRLMGFYRDSGQEHYCGYSIASGIIISEGAGACG